MKPEMILIEATLNRANRKKDRSVTMGLTTNFEVSNEDFAKMDTFVGHAGWFMFKDNPIDIVDIPKGEASTNEKADSEWLVKIMYAYWKQMTDESVPFNVYKSQQYNKVGEWYKSRMPEREV